MEKEEAQLLEAAERWERLLRIAIDPRVQKTLEDLTRETADRLATLHARQKSEGIFDKAFV